MVSPKVKRLIESPSSEWAQQRTKVDDLRNQITGGRKTKRYKLEGNYGSNRGLLYVRELIFTSSHYYVCSIYDLICN